MPKSTTAPATLAAADPSILKKTAIISIRVKKFVLWSDGESAVELASSIPEITVKRTTVGTKPDVPTLVIKGGAKELKFQMEDTTLYAVGGVSFTQINVPNGGTVDPLGYTTFPTRMVRDGVCVVDTNWHNKGPEDTGLYKFSIVIQEKAVAPREGFVDPGIENQE
jgi:hypothetical protein